LPEIWMYLGLNANANEDRRSAEKYLRKAISLRERNANPEEHLSVRKAYIALGRILLNTGRENEGNRLLRKAREMQMEDLAGRQEKVAMIKSNEGIGVSGAVGPDIPEADSHAPLSFAPAFNQKQHASNALAEKAEVQLRALLGSSFNDLATAEAFQQQFDLALKHYLSARDWAPNIPGLSRNLGLAYFYAGQPANAISVLQPVVARAPSDVQATRVLAQCYFAEKNYVKTAHLVNLISAEVEEDTAVNFIWAKSLARVGRRRDAVVALNRAEKMHSGEDIQFLLDCGKLWDELSEHERAKRCFRAVLSLDPGNVTARQALSISDSGVAKPK